MSRILSCIVLALSAAAAPAREAAPTSDPEPARWLEQLVGDWDCVGREAGADPQAAGEATSCERVRAVGTSIVMEGDGTAAGRSFRSVHALGYDAARERFTGTWIGSLSDLAWQIEGTLDATGRILTLESEGPRPDDPARRTRYRDVIELRDANHRTVTSFMLGDDGAWTALWIVECTRRCAGPGADAPALLEAHVEERVARPVADVFAALIEPEQMANYFISGASGPTRAGTTVVWEFADVGAKADVHVIEVVENRRLVCEWSVTGPRTRATIELTPVDAETTLVAITEGGWPADAEGARAAMGQTAGWTYTLCGLKAWLQHGVNLRTGLVAKLTHRSP